MELSETFLILILSFSVVVFIGLWALFIVWAINKLGD